MCLLYTHLLFVWVFCVCVCMAGKETDFLDLITVIKSKKAFPLLEFLSDIYSIWGRLETILLKKKCRVQEPVGVVSINYTLRSLTTHTFQ